MSERYSHMCRDDHEQIGHNDSEHEMCPVCRAKGQHTQLVTGLQQVITEMSAGDLRDVLHAERLKKLLSEA